MTNADENERVHYYFDRFIDIQLKAIDDMCKYNTVVCSIGYVSILAILSYLHSYMYYSLLCIASLCYAVSVAIFVIFEIIKIFINNSYRNKFMANLDNYIQGNIEKDGVTNANLDEYYKSYNNFAKYQSLFFIPSAILGFSSGFIIVLNLVIIACKSFMSHCCCN